MSKEKKKTGMYQNVMKQFNHAADVMNLDDGVRQILSATNNEIVVHFPVKLDNGKIKVFTGYRVQHNNALGPYKGGLRYHSTVDIDAARALAIWMTWKTSLAGLPYGGGKGGIEINPKDYSQNELERITRRFTYALGDNIGPNHDIPAPDVNTNAQIMAWISDCYVSTKAPSDRHNQLAVVTGKPVGSGGLEGRDRATGFGVVATIKSWSALKNIPLKDKKYIVQGFGNVGYWASQLMHRQGAVVVGVSDVNGAIYNPNGLDMNAVGQHYRESGTISDFGQADHLSNAELLELDCDILVPAAIDNVITHENASNIKATLLLEAANHPITPAADEILSDMGVRVLPDILVNSGGVIVSYFEWTQNLQEFSWEETRVNGELQRIIIQAYNEVAHKVATDRITHREAAFELGLERVAHAVQLRGFI